MRRVGGIAVTLLPVVVAATLVGGCGDTAPGTEAPTPAGSSPAAGTPTPTPSPTQTAGAMVVQVRVTGTEGIPFTGSLATLAGSRSVEGTVPETFTIRLSGESDVPTARMQKTGPNGELRVQLVRDGEVVRERATSAPYGVVSVTGD